MRPACHGTTRTVIVPPPYNTRWADDMMFESFSIAVDVNISIAACFQQPNKPGNFCSSDLRDAAFSKCWYLNNHHRTLQILTFSILPSPSSRPVPSYAWQVSNLAPRSSQGTFWTDVSGIHCRRHRLCPNFKPHLVVAKLFPPGKGCFGGFEMQPATGRHI